MSEAHKLTEAQARMIAEAAGNRGSSLLLGKRQAETARRLVETGLGEIRGDDFTGRYFVAADAGRAALARHRGEAP